MGISMIDRKKLIGSHDPVLTAPDETSPLTIGNGELAFTADVTGMQTLYDEYKVLPLCTMSQWGWHTKPADGARRTYTLDELEMTEYYDSMGRRVLYPQEKKKGNEQVYEWLRMNPHRLNLARIGFSMKGKNISSKQISDVNQRLSLYEGVLYSTFKLDGMPVSVASSCHNRGRGELSFMAESEAFISGGLEVRLCFPYGSPDITASDWKSKDRHVTRVVKESKGSVIVKRVLDLNCYYVGIGSNGSISVDEKNHTAVVKARGSKLELTVSFSGAEADLHSDSAADIAAACREGWRDFWENGGIISLNKSSYTRARELERRIILSQYLMAVNSSGSKPPQETGLTCNSWYGKMHLEMYLWHCAWLPLWNHSELLERSLKWYREHLSEAKKNAAKNGYKGARWPKMVGPEGVDSPSPIAPLLIWQQPHIIYMLEMAYQNLKSEDFLKENLELVAETADFMADLAIWNEENGCFELGAPVIPVQECHRAEDVKNPAFELSYWRLGLRLAAEWMNRLERPVPERWRSVAERMSVPTVRDGVYLAHESCPDTFTKYNRDHPSMLGSYGLIFDERIDQRLMAATLQKVEECWDYQSLWGWDFALMAMTAVRLGEPETAIRLLLKNTAKNCYVTSGNNMQRGRADLPLYLPGNGSLLLAAAMMTAGFKGCSRATPGFPNDGSWIVEYENIEPFPV